jgi:hypothetical protein
VLFITSDNFNKIQELGVRKRRQIAQNPVRYKPNLQRFAGRFSCVFLGKVRCSKRGRGAHKRDGTNRKITAVFPMLSYSIFSLFSPRNNREEYYTPFTEYKPIIRKDIVQYLNIILLTYFRWYIHTQDKFETAYTNTTQSIRYSQTCHIHNLLLYTRLSTC